MWYLIVWKWQHKHSILLCPDMFFVLGIFYNLSGEIWRQSTMIITLPAYSTCILYTRHALAEKVIVPGSGNALSANEGHTDAEEHGAESCGTIRDAEVPVYRPMTSPGRIFLCCSCERTWRWTPVWVTVDVNWWISLYVFPVVKRQTCNDSEQLDRCH